MTQHVQKFDRHGRPLPADDDIIPDGGHVRVPATFMDHRLSEEVRRALNLTMDGSNGDMDVQGFIPGHRPGFAVRAISDQASAARDGYIRRINDAWKHPEEVKAKKPASTPNKPASPKPPSSAPKKGMHDGDAAYARYVHRIANAWR